MRKNTPFLVSILSIAFLIIASVSFSFAAIIPLGWGIYRAPVAAPWDVSLHGICKTVSNTCWLDIMIPGSTLNQWTGFINYKPSCVSVEACTNCTVDINGSPTTILNGKTYLPNGQSSTTMYSCKDGIATISTRCPDMQIGAGDMTMIHCPTTEWIGSSTFPFRYTNYGSTTFSSITVNQCSKFHASTDISEGWCDSESCWSNTWYEYRMSNSPVGTYFQDYYTGRCGCVDSEEGCSGWECTGGWDNYYMCGANGSWTRTSSSTW